MIVTIVLFVLAVICYTVSQSVIHGKFNLYGGLFWNQDGWLLKYKQPLTKVNNWYYHLIGAKYRERWFTSTWMTVAFTDSYHASQALFKIFLCLSFVPFIGWIWAGVLWVTWGIVFSVVYKYSQK